MSASKRLGSRLRIRLGSVGVFCAWSSSGMRTATVSLRSSRTGGGVNGGTYAAAAGALSETRFGRSRRGCPEGGGLLPESVTLRWSHAAAQR